MKEVYLCVLAVLLTANLFAQVQMLESPRHLLQVQENPANYAAVAPLDYDLVRDGVLENSKDVVSYKASFEALNAKGIQLYFSKLDLSEGSILRLQNDEGKVQIICSKDNPDGGPYASTLFRGEKLTMVLEMASKTAIDRVVVEEYGYAYRDPFPPKAKRDFGTSDTCQVNARCAEGDQWDDEIRSVVRISAKVGGSAFWCSGVLVNNTNQDCAGYIYSAEHCADGITPGDYEQWVFYFLYESPDCSNPGSEGVLDQKTLTGCSKIASGGGFGNTDSDFLLLKLTQEVPQFYNPHFAGWDRGDVVSDSGVGIHHPDGDIKKISSYTSIPTTSSFGGSVSDTHWRTLWSGTANGHGVTEIGSSGSPLFNSSGHLVGTLSGGASACSVGGGTGPNEPDFYGKMSYSWDQISTDSSRQLKPWLDPTASEYGEIDGIDWPCLEEPIVSIQEEDVRAFKMYPNPSNGIVTVENQLQGKQEIQVYDLLGRGLLNTTLERQIQLNLIPGMYFVVAGNQTQKLMVR